ncbi:MAG: serine/threonine protein kinase [Planctomycetota bacterium]|nr:MAG: serine/threonine protein kinase [Planctomycetota bacterium]REK24392.1 MAG: serine/threonine protein kinase [Planctomycetota bacterium]REK38583.1 MAG: serine/threonine protein kinase [Planctomycetota bacterium]
MDAESPRTDQATGSAMRRPRESDTFSVLADHVCRFVEAWESTEKPPELGHYLPGDTTLRRTVLVELIKADLEYRFTRFVFPKRLSEYQSEFPSTLGESLPAELIYEEFQARRASGLAVEAEEFLQEYPQQAEAVRRLLGLSDEFRATVVVDPNEQAALDGVQPGERLDDFELLVELGRGAFAKVFLSRQISMQRLVAVKVSSDEGTEPQTLAQLDHDHIVRVYDQRVLPDQKLRLLYMQYVPGGTLQEVVYRLRDQGAAGQTGRLLLDVVDEALEARGELRPSDSSVRRKLAGYEWPDAVAWLGARLAQALDYAHQRGVLHRDVKPANVLLTGEAEPKLADFNISFSESVSGATPAAYFGGSLAFMSPEQLEAFHPGLDRQPEELDARSDVYSLGVMLWELLTGKRPFDEEQPDADWDEILERMIATRRKGLQKPRPEGCSATLYRVLKRCLAPEPDDRWQTAAALAQQLEFCLEPAARELIDPPKSEFSSFCRRFAVPILVLMVLIPNALAGVYNYSYNRAALEQEPNAAELLAVFERVQMVINLIAFPLGVAAGVWLVRRAMRVVNMVHDLGRSAVLDDTKERFYCLRLGEQAALICLCLWVAAGVAYPISLHIGVGELPLHLYLTFLGSLTICGLIATAYPFFLATLFCLGTLYPVFLKHGLSGAEDANELSELLRRLQRYLIGVGIVPLLAVVGLTLPSFGGEAIEPIPMLLVCLGGIAGLVFASMLNRRLQASLSGVVDVIRRSESNRPA